MLWLSLLFPRLALEIASRASPDEGPLLIRDGSGNRQWIHDCNQAAADRGVTAGMSLGAARALAAHGRLVPRDQVSEEEALARIADWAGQFTPLISLLPPQGMVLEIGASLVLFGGLPALAERIRSGLDELGYSVISAAAPTPLGAWLLARAGDESWITDTTALRRRLGRLPLATLEFPDATLAALQGMGLRRIEDCLRLPPAGLARRLGPDALLYLRRALGDLPDPRAPYASPATFRSRLVLPAEVESTEALLFATRRLLLELCGYLRARGMGVQRLLLELHHRGRPPTRLTVGLLAPSREPSHLTALVRSRLEPLQLTAPVDELVLASDDVQPVTEQMADLFAHRSPTDSGVQLVDHLRARLGPDAVCSIAAVADHRPEQAWRIQAPGNGGPQETPAAVRPLWLLEQPQRLEERAGRPCLDGQLALLAGPERIESGWWDQEGVARDYYVARDGQLRMLWIYRETRGERCWYVQGIFA